MQQDNHSNTPETTAKGRAIPRGVWVLGFVSLFMDVSSEMVHSLLPVFFVSVIGLSYTAVGVIEGIAEATALIVKVFSGVFSDLLRKRKSLMILGYGLAAVTKPVFALASTAGWVVSARFVDRIGKGIRGAPRDALIADITPEEVRGASYGLRQSLDTVGAVIGPLLALLLLALLANNIRAVFWFAVVPAVLSVGLLWIGIKEDKPSARTGKPESPLHFRDVRQLGKGFWWIVAVGGALTLARFSEAFLILRAQDIGLTVTYIPLVLITMNVVYALSAYPAGVLSDRWQRRSVIVLGFIVLILADLALAFAVDIWQVMIGVVLWGLFMGLTHGVLSAMVADAAPENLRGTAFGLFNLVSGVTLLFASVIAGFLWDQYGAPAPFLASAIFASLALLALLVVQRKAPVRS